jgi:hypothetical protein
MDKERKVIVEKTIQRILEKLLVGVTGKVEKRTMDDEKTSRSKLGGMGMMGKWIEVGTQLGIKVMLTISFPLGAYWKGRDA